MNHPLLLKFFPFLRWFPVDSATVRTDLIAGLSVALVIVPKAMAYAQLAGLPPYFGLYAAFLPVIIGALWGSSSQLATGPVAVISLMTASALSPLAQSGSDQFIMLAILLAFMVGVIQISLGALKLGVVVNFISHPVIIGFTSAAAIIIVLSQVSKLLGVSMGRSENFMQDVWGVALQIGNTHWPTLLMGCSALFIMWAMKKFLPKWPGVLIAVVLTTAVSWYIGFERSGTGKIAQIADSEVRALALKHGEEEAQIATLSAQILEKSTELKRLQKTASGTDQHSAALKYQIELLQIQLRNAESESRKSARDLRKFVFTATPGSGGDIYHLHGTAPAGSKTDDLVWRIKKMHGDVITLSGGGEVVGAIPAGLPSLSLPKFSLDAFMSLLSSAFVIALVGFMEAVAMSKAIAAKTKERINPNQELIGQGLANMTGSISQSYPVCGSFSGSALNLDAGAKTGLASVFNGLFVMVTLLFLTPFLYYLPQAVLAAIIMMAVKNLLNFGAIKHAWRTHKHDGFAATLTFFATVGLAPHLDQGILMGAGLALILYLYRTMKPRVAVLGRHADGTLRDAKVHDLLTSKHVVAVRFDGSLYFANVPYFEDAILEAVANNPTAKHLLVVGDGINQLDASGEEVIRHLVERQRENGVTTAFSGLKKQVLEIMQHTGLDITIGAENFYRTEDMALQTIFERVCALDPSAEFCPLRPT